MERSNDNEAGTDLPQVPRTPLTNLPQSPVVRVYRGGKKGARKPSKLLMDMRWCYKTAPKEEETLTPGRASCRKLQKAEPLEFLKMLRDLEKALLAGRPKPAPGSSGTGTGASGSAGPAPLDKGEETTREMIDKLLKDFQPK